MKTVFIDSQIWLSLYDFSKDDLDQFSKLNDLIGTDIDIVLTTQIIDEVNRNRESKIKDSLTQFKDITYQIPNLCKGYDEYTTFIEIYKTVQTLHKDLLRKVETDIETESLHADQVIRSIFEKIKPIKRTDEIIEKAKIRFDIGNPPGKSKSYGDSINWIILLEKIKEGTDLFFISNDKDFRSVVNDNRMNQYLVNEWKTKKKSDIFFYRTLTDFFNLHLKHIELKTDTIKNALIERLENSGAFATTHTIISEMTEYLLWNDDQVLKMLRAAESNNQVWGIIDDPDLSIFFKKIVKDHFEYLHKNESLAWILGKIGNKNGDTVEDDEYPF